MISLGYMFDMNDHVVLDDSCSTRGIDLEEACRMMGVNSLGSKTRSGVVS
jgi:hypothetical protein